MTKDLIDKILPEIQDWDILLDLLKSFSFNPGPEINVILKKANSLVYELDMENLDNTAIKEIKSIFSGINMDNLFYLCYDSFLGNLVWLSYLIDYSGGIIDSNNVKYLEYVQKLEYIEDIATIQPDFGRKLLIRLDENIPENVNRKFVLTALRLLYRIGIVELDKDLIEAFKILLKSTDNPNDRKILLFIEILEKCDVKQLIREYNTLTGKTAKKIEDIDFREFYKKLLEIGCPVFFNHSRIRYNGVVYNGNFFPMRYIDKNGNIKIIKPFTQIPIDDVQKLEDPIRNIWFTPKERYGKIRLDDIYSFKEIKGVTCNDIKSDKKLLSKVRRLSEDDIEEKIREIIGELGSTEHTSLELADLFLCKVCINNEDDLRNVAIVIKKRPEKGKQITLKQIGHQILKAVMEDSVELVILIHIAPIADDVRSYLIKLCNKLNKMYCIVDAVELARLFKAYSLI